MHFKHTYTSKKTNEHIPKTRRKIFYGSPKASSKSSTHKNVFPHGEGVFMVGKVLTYTQIGSSVNISCFFYSHASIILLFPHFAQCKAPLHS